MHNRHITLVIAACIAILALEEIVAREAAASDDVGKPVIEEVEQNLPSCTGTALYLELGGKLMYSLNADYRWSNKAAMSLGFQQVEDGFIPSLMYYHFRGKNHRIELGGGLSAILDDGFAALVIHGVYGYRYQKKNGLLFRIGFTPFIGIPLKPEGRFIITPWAGMSLGYSF